MAKTRITKRTIILLVILAVLLIGSGVGYLVWRLSEEEGLAPEDSEAFDCWCTGRDQCPTEDGWHWGGGEDYCEGDLRCCSEEPIDDPEEPEPGAGCCDGGTCNAAACTANCEWPKTNLCVCHDANGHSRGDCICEDCSSQGAYCNSGTCSGQGSCDKEFTAADCPDGWTFCGTSLSCNGPCAGCQEKGSTNCSASGCSNKYVNKLYCSPPDQPGPDPKVCWDSCTDEGSTCDDGTICQNGRCRNPQCPDDSDCQCGAVLSPQCIDVNQTLVRQLTGEIGRVDRFVTNFDDAGMQYAENELEFEISINCVDEQGSPVSGVQITEIGGGGNTGSGPTFSFTDSDNDVELEFALQGITYASCAVTSVPILKGQRYPDADCAATVVISGDIPTPGEPDLRVQKTSNVYCIDEDTPNPKARVDYTIELTNPGSVPIQVNRVVDRPENIRSDWLVSGSIDPSYGEVAEDCSSGICYITSITWVLPEDDYGNIVYPPDSTGRQTKSFRYSVIIPKDYFGSYHNVVTAYTPGDEYTDDEDIFATCKIPKTGLLDNVVGRVALGTMLLLIGLVYIWSNKFERVVIKFYPGEGVIKDERINDVRRKFQEKVLRSTDRDKD